MRDEDYDLRKVYRVIHAKDGVETLYLVSAFGRRDAETQVLDLLYMDRRHYFREETPERLANDTFGLIAAGQHGTWNNSKLCKDVGCSVSAIPWVADEPYRLYAIDTKTGVMS